MSHWKGSSWKDKRDSSPLGGRVTHVAPHPPKGKLPVVSAPRLRNLQSATAYQPPLPQLLSFGEWFFLKQAFPRSFSAKQNGQNQGWHLLQSALFSLLSKSLYVLFLYDFISQHKISREGEWVFKNQLQTACSDVNEHSPAVFANLYWILVHQTEKENKLRAWLPREA